MKTNIRAVIIDDEPGCIANLAYHLHRYCPELQVIATGASVQEAARIFSTEQFDVVFLDVALSEDTIFSVLDRQMKAAVVFVTAYEQYAVQAFRIDAADYLVKPLSEGDIRACYTKIKRKLSGIINLPHEIHAAAVPEKKIMLRQGEQVYVARQKDVYCLEARGFYSLVLCHINDRQLSVLVSKPISRLEEEYDRGLFFRVHKSFLINTGQVTEIIRNETLQVRLANGMLVPVAKRRAAAFLSHIYNNTAAR